MALPRSRAARRWRARRRAAPAEATAAAVTRAARASSPLRAQLGEAQQRERGPPFHDVEVVRERGRPAAPVGPWIDRSARPSAGGGAHRVPRARARRARRRARARPTARTARRLARRHAAEAVGGGASAARLPRRRRRATKRSSARSTVTTPSARGRVPSRARGARTAASADGSADDAHSHDVALAFERSTAERSTSSSSAKRSAASGDRRRGARARGEEGERRESVSAAPAVYECRYGRGKSDARTRVPSAPLTLFGRAGHSTSSPTRPSMIRKKRLPIGHLALYGWLPSPIKVWAYRTFRGYKIGKGVKLAFGGVVVGDDVELADHVEIGLLAMVMGRTISIGRHSSVGTMSYVACERIQIGEDARIREQVFVGGPQLPESSFTLGQPHDHPAARVDQSDEAGDDRRRHGHRRALPDLHARRVAQRAGRLSGDVRAGDARQQRVAALARVHHAGHDDRRRQRDRRELARAGDDPADEPRRRESGEGDPFGAGLPARAERGEAARRSSPRW